MLKEALVDCPRDSFCFSPTAIGKEIVKEIVKIIRTTQIPSIMDCYTVTIVPKNLLKPAESLGIDFKIYF